MNELSEEEIIKRIEKIRQDFKLYNPLDKIELEAIERFIRFI